MSIDLIDNAIKLFTELLEVRENIFKIYIDRGNSKDATTLTFRIKNYAKWIDKLKSLKDNNISIKTIDDIKSQKFTSKLQDNMIDILENGKLIELDEANNELLKLQQNNSISNTDTTTTTVVKPAVKKVVKRVQIPSNSPLDNKIDTTTKEQPTILEIPLKNTAKNIKKTVICSTNLDLTDAKIGDILSSSDKHLEVDVKNLHAIPKNLDDVKRPIDAEGAAIYDLLLVHGIGESAAKKLRKHGITLELLLEDWRNFVDADENNNILMYSKMLKPDDINDKIWAKKSDIERESVQMNVLKNKLEMQTRYLSELSYEQLVGVKHFYNIRAERIPRSEVELNVIVLQESIKKFNSEMIATICGSYRRGKPSSGDIDCLITHPTYTTEFIESLGDKTDSGILTGFITKLTKSGYLVDHLTPGGKKYYKGMAEITGISACPRRIDIKLVPYDCYGAALLHATGSQKFNTDLRSFALSKGYTLNEYGLYKYSNGKKGELVNSKTEEDIFKILGYPYKTPQERDI